MGVAKGKNVIAIQVESLQNFAIGLKVDGKEVTPNLNKLLANSMYFSNYYTQVGQGTTSDSEFMFNTSLYPLEDGGVSQVYGNKSFPSLPKLLKQEGYQTLTLHQNKVSFWNRNDLYPALGFDKYYDQAFFGQDDFIGMGASDDVLFTKGMSVLKEQKQPFYAQFITLSSHHPFEVPSDKVSDFKSNNPYQDTITWKYLEAVHYADSAIGRFIEELKSNGLWDNTLLVVYGDHFGLLQDKLTDQDHLFLKELLGRDYDALDPFNIPMIMKLPNQQEGIQINKIGGQIDTMPTISNLLGLDISQQIHFGQDILNTNKNLLGIRFYLPTGSFISDEWFSGTNMIMSLEERKLVSVSTKEEENRIVRLMQMSDSYLKSLPNR